MEIDGKGGLPKFIWRRPKIPSNDSWLVEYFKGGKGIRHGDPLSLSFCSCNGGFHKNNEV